MGLIENDPVRSPGPCSQTLQTRDELGKECWPVLQRQPEQAHRHIGRRIFQAGENLTDTRRTLRITQTDYSLQRTVVPLGIDDADLVRLIDEPLNQSSRQCRFATSRGPSNENVATIRWNTHGRPVAALANK
jgi:hypothetical protein